MNDDLDYVLFNLNETWARILDQYPDVQARVAALKAAKESGICE